MISVTGRAGEGGPEAGHAVRADGTVVVRDAARDGDEGGEEDED